MEKKESIPHTDHRGEEHEKQKSSFTFACEEEIASTAPFLKLIDSGQISRQNVADFLYFFLLYHSHFFKDGNPYKHLALNVDVECIDEFLDENNITTPENQKADHRGESWKQALEAEIKSRFFKYNKRQFHKVEGDPNFSYEDYKAQQTILQRSFIQGAEWAKQFLTPESREESAVTRIEVIEHYTGGNGRNYVNWNKDNKVELSYQDNNRTLKIFITRNP